MRLVLLVGLALLASGCLAMPADPAAPGATRDTSSEPPAERIDGMTASESAVDEIVSCGGGNVQIPPGTCAHRVLTVEGRIGVDRLPVDLSTVNGDVAIVAGSGDAWSFVADIRVRGLTEDIARKGLDTAWTWSHEAAGEHRLYAAPIPQPTLDAPGATLEHASYQIVLPSWIVLDVEVKTTNGAVSVDGFAMDGLAIQTTNGEIEIRGECPDVSATTTNGEIDATIATTASGSISLSTTNGEIDLLLREDAQRGYDLTARTTNGEIEITLEDGTVTRDPLDRDDGTASFKTNGYESRAIQTKVTLETTNGEVTVAPGA